MGMLADAYHMRTSDQYKIDPLLTVSRVAETVESDAIVSTNLTGLLTRLQEGR